ncbi:unnamed protein product [Rhizophagus irregularis]|nr:unnamed protein product [Rhizophagus irregularis]
MNLKKFKFSIENNLYRYKLSQNTFLPVGFQITKEILGYLDVEDFNIHEEEKGVEEEGAEEEGAEEECSGGGGTVITIDESLGVGEARKY